MNLVHNRNNHVIFSILISKIYNQSDKSLKLIHKIKNKDEIINIDDYDIRVRKSKEAEVNKKHMDDLMKISHIERFNIIFRYKQRISLILVDNEEAKISIDLTSVKQNNDINELEKTPENYELEIDIQKKISTKKNYLDMVFNEIIILKKILQNSKVIISKQSSNQIMNDYKKLIFGKNVNLKKLYSMQPISAEVQHVVDRIPNKYAATDKADGEKFCMYVNKGEIYLISNNLDIKSTGLKIKNADETLIEGEYVYIEKYKKYLFLPYDILFYKGKDVRNKFELKSRLDTLNQAMNEMFPYSFDFKEFNGEFSIDNIKTFYKKEIKRYFDNMDKLLNKEDINTIFLRKFFVFPTGGSSSEIFSYSALMWELYTETNDIKCPYILDGIIFTGLEQKYTSNKNDWKYPMYKYKPPSHNSIDFYIKFERNQDSNQIINVFDNSDNTKLQGKPYRIANLFVGDSNDNEEVPIPFQKHKDNNQAYFLLDNEEVRDIQGNVIKDGTVIELAYDNDISIPHKFRWRILRTRLDKTEQVIKYKKQYGNFKDVADKTWNSIIESLGISDLKTLGNPSTYEAHMKYLKSKVDTSVITIERKEDIYYQKITNLIKPMREWHNFIKSLLIFTYCSPKFISRKDAKKQKIDVFDIGCGRGGDNMKMYHARVKNYVGIDIDYHGIHSSTDGAISRYNTLKKKFPNFTNMTFINADAGTLLNAEDQTKILGSNMSNENKSLISKNFESDRQYDIINCQFAFHYFFESDNKLDNVCKNMNKHLKNGGYLLLTMFDGDKIIELLNDNDSYKSEYTDDEGKNNLLFEIVKKYGNIKDFNQTNIPIDVHMSWISNEDKYITEYVVTKEHLIKTLAEKVGLKLVDTQMFGDLYNINKEFFMNTINYEENEKNKQFFMKVKSFYELEKDIDKESKVYSDLFRYYIFQKVDGEIKIPEVKQKQEPEGKKTSAKEKKTSAKEKKKVTKEKKTPAKEKKKVTKEKKTSAKEKKKVTKEKKKTTKEKKVSKKISK
jgi:SAM-dependent methyltransferase